MSVTTLIRMIGGFLTFTIHFSRNFGLAAMNSGANHITQIKTKERTFAIQAPYDKSHLVLGRNMPHSFFVRRTGKGSMIQDKTYWMSINSTLGYICSTRIPLWILRHISILSYLFCSSAIYFLYMSRLLKKYICSRAPYLCGFAALSIPQSPESVALSTVPFHQTHLVQFWYAPSASRIPAPEGSSIYARDRYQPSPCSTSLSCPAYSTSQPR